MSREAPKQLKKSRVGFAEMGQRDLFISHLDDTGIPRKSFKRPVDGQDVFYVDIMVASLGIARGIQAVDLLLKFSDHWKGYGPICGATFEQTGGWSKHGACKLSTEAYTWACTVCDWSKERDDSSFMPVDDLIRKMMAARQTVPYFSPNYYGVDTGRMSYSRPELQNIPMPPHVAKKMLDRFVESLGLPIEYVQGKPPETGKGLKEYTDYVLSRLNKRDRIAFLYGADMTEIQKRQNEKVARFHERYGMQVGRGPDIVTSAPKSQPHVVVDEAEAYRDIQALDGVADEAYRFWCGLNLQDQPLAIQRQARDILQKLGKVLKARSPHKGGRDP